MQITSIQTRTMSVNYIKNPRIPSVNQMNLLFLSKRKKTKKKELGMSRQPHPPLSLSLSLSEDLFGSKENWSEKETERVCC